MLLKYSKVHCSKYTNRIFFRSLNILRSLSTLKTQSIFWISKFKKVSKWPKVSKIINIAPCASIVYINFWYFLLWQELCTLLWNIRGPYCTFHFLTKCHFFTLDYCYSIIRLISFTGTINSACLTISTYRVIFSSDRNSYSVNVL